MPTPKRLPISSFHWPHEFCLYTAVSPFRTLEVLIATDSSRTIFGLIDPHEDRSCIDFAKTCGARME